MERALLLIDGFPPAGRYNEAVPGGGSSLQRSHCGGRMLWQPRLDGEQRCRYNQHSAQLLVSQLQRQEDCGKRQSQIFKTPHTLQTASLHLLLLQTPCGPIMFLTMRKYVLGQNILRSSEKDQT